MRTHGLLGLLAALGVVACHGAPSSPQTVRVLLAVDDLRQPDPLLSPPSRFERAVAATTARPSGPWCMAVEGKSKNQEVCSDDGSGKTIDLPVDDCYKVAVDMSRNNSVDARTGFCIEAGSQSSDKPLQINVVVLNSGASSSDLSLAVQPQVVRSGGIATARVEGKATEGSSLRLRLLNVRNPATSYWQSAEQKVGQAVDASFEIPIGTDWPTTDSAAGSAYMVQALVDGVVVSAASLVILSVDDQPAPEPTTTPVVSSCGGDDGMIDIPAGYYWRGCAPGDAACLANEKPSGYIWISAFAADCAEVTVARYSGCVAAGACSGAKVNGVEWQNQPWISDSHCNYSSSGNADMPMNCVTWDEADAFCRWEGKRLLTEAQWEKAARGTDLRSRYWGSAALPPAGGGNYSDETLHAAQPTAWTYGPYFAGYNDGYLWSSPSGIFANEGNPYGMKDVGGNVREWVADWYSASAYSSAITKDPVGTDSSSGYRGDRGDDFILSTPGRVSFRWYGPAYSRSISLGIRCAK